MTGSATQLRKLLEEKGNRPALTSSNSTQSLDVILSAKKTDVPLHVIICYDVTSSMSPYIEVVQENISKLNAELLTEDKGIHISICGVGDYCDGQYMWQPNDFSNDPLELQRQIDKIKCTNGGDFPEAYEKAFMEISRLIDKRKSQGFQNSKYVTVLIGDSYPHGIDDSTHANLDYRVTLPAMKSRLSYFAFVSPQEDGEVLKTQKTLVDIQSKDEIFIRMKKDFHLTHLLIALIKQERAGANARDDYLKRLTESSFETGNAIKAYLTG